MQPSVEPISKYKIMNPEVSRYYDYTLPFYKFFWHEGTNAIHYGYWDDDTKSHKEALINTNKTLADLVEPTRLSKVLDAGGGVGGSSIWLAQNYGTHVVGVTISSKQKKQADKNAQKACVENLTEFYLRDYRHTGFTDSSFDIVWGLESVCHAEDKKDFLREAYRVLKPGGKLIIADGFLTRLPKTTIEKHVYDVFIRGLALSNLATIGEFQEGLTRAGFKNIQMFNKTPHIQKTAQHMYGISCRWVKIFAIARALRLVPQMIVDTINAGLVQLDFFTKGVGGYYVFYAEK